MIELTEESLKQAEILRASWGNGVAERYLSFLHSSEYLNRPCELIEAEIEFVNLNLNLFFPYRCHVSKNLVIKTAKALEIHPCGRELTARCLFYELRQMRYKWKSDLKDWRISKSIAENVKFTKGKNNAS